MSDATTPSNPQAPVTAVATETPAVVEAPKAPPKSDAFAALAKREKAIVRRDQEIKAREQALAEKDRQFQEWQKSREEDDRTWQSNPLEALKKRNVSYEQLTNVILNGEKPTPEMVAAETARQQIEEFKKSQAEERRQAAEAQQKAQEQQYNAALDQFRGQIKDFVSTNSDQYELISLYDANETVLATIEQHWQKTKRVLDVKEAADLVEKYLDEQASKIQQTKKFQAKVQPQPKADSKQTTNAPRPPTLNNNLSATAPASNAPLSWEERYKRAMAVGRDK